MKKIMMLILLLLWVVPMAWAAEPPPDRKVGKFEFAIPTPGYDPVRNEWCNLIAENWKKLGIDVDVKPVDTSVMIAQGLRKHDFDTMVLSWGGMPERIEPDYFIYSVFDSSQA